MTATILLDMSPFGFFGVVGLVQSMAVVAAQQPVQRAESVYSASSGQSIAVTVPVVPHASAALVFDHVTVVDVVHGNLVREQRVVVTGHRIAAIGRVDAVPVPPAAHVVEARGKYLIPGLWDMYLHLWLAPETVGYPLLLANGVTGLRDPGSPVPLAMLTRWKQEIAAGTRIGPRLVVAGPAIFQCPLVPPASDYQYGVCVTTPADAPRVVDSLKRAGADFLELSIDGKLTWPQTKLFFALAAAARQAGLPFGGHVSAWVSSTAVDSGARFLNNTSYFLSENHCEDWYVAAAGPVPCAAAMDSMRRHDTWMVLSPLLPRFHYQVEQYRRYLPAANPEDWAGSPPKDPEGAWPRFDIPTWFAVAGSIPAATRPATTAAWKTALSYIDSITGVPLFSISPQGQALEAARGPVVVGTDAVFASSAFVGLPGFALHDALAMLVVGGMTPRAALQAATIQPARALHLADSLGTVDAGKLADLVLLDADPLVEINNTTKIRAVVANGRYYDRASLDRLLAEAAQNARRGR